MADKEERIYICKTFKTDPCEICEGSGQIECALCRKKTMFDKSISRAEAVERMAKAIYFKACGTMKDYAKCKKEYIPFAEASLDALLGRKK